MKLNTIISLLLITLPFSTNYSHIGSNHKSHTVRSIKSNKKVLPLSASKKISKRNKGFEDIYARQEENKNLISLKKDFQSTVERNVTINLQSDGFFNYTISYASWIKDSDGSFYLKTEKYSVKKGSKNDSIKASFFNIGNLTMHVELSGQKDTKFTFVNSDVLQELIKSKFKNDANPSFTLNVSGELTNPKASLNFIGPNKDITKVGTFEIESLVSWWEKNSDIMIPVIVIVCLMIMALGLTTGVGFYKYFPRAENPTRNPVVNPVSYDTLPPPYYENGEFPPAPDFHEPNYPNPQQHGGLDNDNPNPIDHDDNGGLEFL